MTQRQRRMRLQNDGFGYCSSCSKGEHHNQLVGLGEEVMDSGRRGAIYSFYQCARCGHIWQYREEVGPGGGNNSYTILTKPAPRRD